MKFKRKIFINRKTQQLSITLPKKKIEQIIKTKKGKSPRWININLKEDIEW